ncbi:hypothetical protein ACHAXT_005193 [Thalassiosira profunda]
MGKSSAASAPSSSSSSSAAADDNKHAQKLQAVLLADAFSDAWRPVTDEPCPPPTACADTSSDGGVGGGACGAAGGDGTSGDAANGDGTSGDGSMNGFAGWEASKGSERPLALCPLNNVPLLHHALDLLQGSGVEELFLVCSAGGDALEAWLRDGAGGARGGAPGGTPGGGRGGTGAGGDGGGSSRIVWSSKLTVTLLRFADCTNAGDALRELDRRALIKSDPFVLMQGDVVSNVDLRGAMAAHKARRKKDHAAIMTVLLQEAGGWGLDDDAAWEESDEGGDGEEGEGAECNPNSPNDGPLLRRAHHQLPQRRAADDDLLLALDPTHDHRILLWDAHPHRAQTSIPSIFFRENSARILLTRNCLDVGIDVCSPDVLARFSDEFDYRDLRAQFVANCAAEEEAGLQSRIFAHFLKRGEYAARAGDPRRYHAASMDLLRRWGYPLVPDNGGGGARGAGGAGRGSYVCERHYVYRDAAARSQVGRSTRLAGPLLLGPHTRIGERCTLRRTVLGPNCAIGDGCSIVDSHLWGRAVVEDGAHLTGAILCEGAVVRKGAVLERGCVVGRGCVIGTGVRLSECTRITGVPEREDDDDYSGFDDSDSESSSSEEESTEGEESEGAGSCEKVATAVGGAPCLPTAPPAVDAVTDHELVGPDGRGRAYTPSPLDDCDSDDESEAAAAQAAAVERMRGQSIGCDLTAMLRKRTQLQREDEDDGFSVDRTDGADGDLAMDGDDWGADAGTATADSHAHLDDDGMQITGRQRGVDVVKELRDICLEHELSSPVENLRIELNSFKFSQNATYADCCRGATLAVMERIAGAEGVGNGEALTPGKLVAKLKSALEYWGPLFRSLCRGTEEERAVVAALESLAVGSMAAVLGREPAFRFALQTLHDEEVVNEGAIREWAAERRAGDREGPVGALFWQKPTQDFLEWLEDDESSSEEGSSSDDDDSD